MTQLKLIRPVVVMASYVTDRRMWRSATKTRVDIKWEKCEIFKTRWRSSEEGHIQKSWRRFRRSRALLWLRSGRWGIKLVTGGPKFIYLRPCLILSFSRQSLRVAQISLNASGAIELASGRCRSYHFIVMYYRHRAYSSRDMLLYV